MGSLLNPVIVIGPIVLGLGLLAMAVCCAVHLIVPGPNKRTSLPRYILLVTAIGGASLVAGTAIGIGAFCSTSSAGNLCGLGGVFGVGPLLCGLCIAAYSGIWLKGTYDAA